MRLVSKNFLSLSIINFLGGHGGEGTPDTIPNSAVKLSIADDTAVIIVGKQAVAKDRSKAPQLHPRGEPSFVPPAGRGLLAPSTPRQGMMPCTSLPL